MQDVDRLADAEDVLARMSSLELEQLIPALDLSKQETAPGIVQSGPLGSTSIMGAPTSASALNMSDTALKLPSPTKSSLFDSRTSQLSPAALASLSEPATNVQSPGALGSAANCRKLAWESQPVSSAEAGQYSHPSTAAADRPQGHSRAEMLRSTSTSPQVKSHTVQRAASRQCKAEGDEALA